MTIWARDAGQGAGRVCLANASPFSVRACWAGAFWAGGAWELCVLNLGPSSWYMDARPGCPWQGSVGFEGQVLRSSLNMVNRVPVALCLACYREWGRGLHV